RTSSIAAIQQEIVAEFIASHPGSAKHHEQAVKRFASGVTHDSRYAEPFQLCVDRAEGAYKWDVDGTRYVDFVTGHGSLILGHGHPDVVGAVSRQLTRGTHLGGNHALELEWAERICAIVPGAELVRFTASGTESGMLAVRIARAWTGRTRLVQFAGHFHGWSDTTFGGHGMPGLPAALQSAATVIACGDVNALNAAVADETAAAVIIETSHPDFFTLPDPGAFLRAIRTATEQTGTLMIVDEVVSGFRWAPGGAQEQYGAHGDITTLAKILSGGLPGGAVTGRADVMSVLSFDPAQRQGRPKIAHPGTYNANPLSSAAGIACLEHVADPATQARATATAAAIRSGVNSTLRREGIPGCAYGDASMFRLALGGEELPPETDLRAPLPGVPVSREGMPSELAEAFNLSMLQHGIALFGERGITSIAHSDDDVSTTVTAFAETLSRLRIREYLDN
ncbi:MAG: aminotransferase class III-fold pyridoxal phosphate-dependent enzyme, partial [Chloroflexota bacterium]|nr:aminotransferase class III-fold pyridoxal phosphate-dependent enzyme [Chloroflexota bacterium]